MLAGRRAGRVRQGVGVSGRPPGVRRLVARRAHHSLHARRHGHGPAVVANFVVARGNRARQQPPRQGGAVRDGQALRHRHVLRRGRSGAAVARRLRLPARVRAGEDRPRPAGAPHPRGNQRNHARRHRSVRSRPGPRVGFRGPRPQFGIGGPVTTIAFLGLGHMGGPMAANLLAAGHSVRGFDPVPAAKEVAANKGAQIFETGAQAAEEADVVITSLPNGDIVKACYAEVVPAARQGTLFIDTSTISVDDAREIHAQAVERGHAQLDAPVSGGVKGATAGTLAFMVGGEDEAVERARPVLEPLAGKIIHCGGSGNGQSAKLCNNMVLAVQQIAVGEAFVLAEKLGLSAQSLFDVITGATGNCWSVHTNCRVPGRVPTPPANNDFKPGFATALMNKDLGLAMDAVNSTGSTAPLGSHAADIYAEYAADHADKDFSAVIELLRGS